MQSAAITGGPNCGGTGFVIGSTSFTPTGADRILAAANNTPGFSYLASSFQQQSGSSVSFLFGPSGNLSTIANGGTVNNVGGSIPGDVLFASADEANVNKTYAAQGSIVAGALSDGSCTTGTCNGDPATKTLYAVGRLAIVSCKSQSLTLPVTGTPTACPESARLKNDMTTCGTVTHAINALTSADVAALLTCDPNLKLSIAAPGTCSVALNTTLSAPNAPYGCAAEQSLTQPANLGGGGISPTRFAADNTTSQIVYTTGDSVTTALGRIRSGTADLAMVPLSFEEAPSGNDTNNWSIVTDSLHDPIRQWAIALKHTDEAVGVAFLKYVTSSAGQSVLAQFGYLPIS